MGVGCVQQQHIDDGRTHDYKLRSKIGQFFVFLFLANVVVVVVIVIVIVVVVIVVVSPVPLLQ